MKEEREKRQKRQQFLQSILDTVERGHDFPNFNEIGSVDEVLDIIINDDRSYSIAGAFIATEYEDDYDLFFQAIVGAPCSFMLQVGGGGWGIVFEELCEFLEDERWNHMD